MAVRRMLRHRSAWVAAVLVASWGAQAVRAAESPDWQRIDSLVSHKAYPLAREELRAGLPNFLGDERAHARYLLGFVERRLGHGAEARELLNGIPSQSLWYARAQQELARELLAEGRESQADETLYRLLGVLTGTERDGVRRAFADQLFVRARFSEALELYHKVMEEAAVPALAEHAAFASGWCYERLKNPARAIYSWKEALRLFPDSVQASPARLMLANQYLMLGKPLLASDILSTEARIAGSPEILARSQFLAGEGYAAVGNWALATAAYAQVKPGTRWTEPAEYGQAYARWQAGDPRGARADLERWLQRYSQSQTRFAVLYALGRVKLELGDPTGGRAAFERAKNEGAGDPYAELCLFGLAELDYNDTRYASCAQRARELLDRYPHAAQRGPTKWLLAESLIAMRQFDAAIAIYNDLAKVEPDLGFLEGKGDAVAFRLGLAHFRTGDFPAAASYLKTVVDSAYGQQALFWLAEATYRTGDYAQALTHYAAYLKRFPAGEQAPEAAYGEAYSAYQLKRYDQALSRFKLAAETLKDAPRKQDSLLRLGTLQLNAHDWPGAIATYNTLFNSQLDDDHLPDVLFGLSYASFRKGSYAEAERLAISFEGSFPANARVNRMRSIAGQAAFRLGRYADAVARFELILQDPRSTIEQKADARARIGAAYFNAGQVDKAIEVYQSLYGESGRTAKERDELAQPLVQALVQHGDLDAAKLIVQDSTRSAWAPEARERLAKAYLDAGKAADAVALLDALDSPTPDQRHLLADAYRAAGNPEASLATLDSLARLTGPRQIDWLAELADRYLDTGNPDRAREIYALLAKLKPGHPDLLKGALGVASAYAKAGHDSVALVAYREVVARFARSTDAVQTAQMRIGQLELKAGHYKEAAIAYRAAEASSPPGSAQQVQARYWLGYALVAAKRFEDAITELSSLKTSSEGDRAWYALGLLKRGEALEHLRRWKDAKTVYKSLADDAKLPDPERHEATDRLKWIDDNVLRRKP